MGVKKLHNLFTAKEKTTSKKSNQDFADKQQSIKDKAEIDSYLKAIHEKLADPNMAKKAAQILEEMLKKSK
jgi:hypothetical protein